MARIPALGSDPDPSPFTGAAAAAYATRDNVWSFQLTQAGAQPVRIAAAGTYDGSGSPGQATFALYLYDPQRTGRWLRVTPVTFSLGTPK